MPIFDLKCGFCERVEEGVWLKPDELPTSTESETVCEKCEEGRMFRVIGAPAIGAIRGIDFGGDASKVRRFEFISKDVETVDHAASKREGRMMLKDK